uniref:Fumarylacetoacetase-like C-terminal domain-containing protein n=1 Tax=Bionectria ochroleuca TaxID=29856 RepID=A0A8H7NBL4_BIOOC
MLKPAHLSHTRDSLTARLVRIFEGGNPWDEGFKLSESRRKVAEVILILPREATKIKVDVMELQGTLPLPHTPVFMCIGLSYKKHADEAGISLLSRLNDGEYPVVFTKPPNALAGPFENIPIPVICHSMDYEAELCLVIGKDCIDFKADNDISEYILSYTVGNDLSSQYWQNPERCVGQHGSAKSFDKFAPIGPVITSTKTIPNLAILQLECFVNGGKR